MQVGIIAGIIAIAFGLFAVTLAIRRQFRAQYEQNLQLRRAASALSQSEQRLRAYAAMAADWFWEQDEQYRFVVDSEIRDTSRGSDVGRTRWELEGAIDDRENWARHRADLEARRPFRNFRWVRLGTDGKLRYMNTSGDPLFDDQGVFIGYHGTGRDVTAEVEAAAALRRAKEEAESANQANAELASAVRFANDAIIGLALDGCVRTWNPAAEQLFGLAAAEIVGEAITRALPDEQKVAIEQAVAAVVGGRPISDLETTIRRPGEQVDVSINAAPVRAPEGAVNGLIVTVRDISDRKQAELALRLREEQLSGVFRDAAVGLSRLDADGRYDLVNDRFCELVGRRRDELLGSSPEHITHPEDTAAALPLLQRLRDEGAGFVTETRYVRQDGALVWVRSSVSPAHGRNGSMTGIVAVAEDVTERKSAEDHLRHLAYHDSLTGLANRVLMNAELLQALDECPPDSGGCVAVLALDLDRFKAINDAFGHDIGDLLLVQVARRLTQSVRPSDTVARVGGDEVVIVLSGLARLSEVADLARRLVELLGQPFHVGGHQARIGTSIGIALYPRDARAPADLLRHADTALYRAKREGRGTYRFFEERIDLRASRPWTIEQDLREAIAHEELALEFQPIFATANCALSGFEALLRWRHPRLGDIEPHEIITVAEESGLIVSLGAWILRAACAHAVRWPEQLRVAVNLSGAQFRDKELAGNILDILQRVGLAPDLLELEVTETLFIDNIENAHSVLHRLKQSGVRIALDDFGTGFSSLSYLRSFPFDKIKIDRSFVQALGSDPNARPIVHAIVAMGHSLGLTVTAEGVETNHQLKLLHLEQCDEIQGFLLGMPVPAASVASYLTGRFVKSGTLLASGSPAGTAGPEGTLARISHTI